MVEKDFSSWRGPREETSGLAVGHSPRARRQRTSTSGRRVGQDQGQEESGPDEEEDSECPVDMAFRC